MDMGGNFEATLWRHRWRHYREKYFFGVIWDGLFISEVRLQLSLIFQNFYMAAIFSSRQTFLPDAITEVEYNSKIAMSISDILSFWSTL